MFETISNKLINLMNFGELRLPSFLLNVSPSFIAPIKFVKCQTTNDYFDLAHHQQQQPGKSHSTQQLIILPLMIKILNQFIKMIDLKTNPNTTVSSNYSKLICSIEYMRDKRFLMSPGTQNTVTATKTGGGSPMGFSLDYIIYFLETDKINEILKNFMNANNNSTDSIIDQSFFIKSDLDLRNFMSFTNEEEEDGEMDISHKDDETGMSPPPVAAVHGDDHHNDSCTKGKKEHSPKRHHSNKPIVKLNYQGSCSNSIVPEIPCERKRRKRRKKNHRGGGPQICHNTNNNNNNNITVDKMSLEITNKKKRRKCRKRQRNHDRDIKSEWLLDQNKTAAAKTSNSVQTTTICEKLFGNCNEQTKICVSFKKLPPSIPLPTPFTFSHHKPLQPTRQRQLSECSNDSLEICFLDDCDIDGMVVDYDYNDDDDDEDDDDEDDIDGGSYSLHTYRAQHRLCGNLEDSDETDSDSGFRDEKKVRFDLKPKIHVMRTWDFAHRQARIGEWETLARDRVRFTDRIKKLESFIAPVLSKEHRDKIFLNRFM